MPRPLRLATRNRGHCVAGYFHRAKQSCNDFMTRVTRPGLFWSLETVAKARARDLCRLTEKREVHT